MSKNSDGPSALSFEKPRKMGWLHKHGGSGMSSHWKKRWFIVDHHYMFYYKGPNDKKPVGILCLPEYQSCHKADSKESKKPNSFVLDKGNFSQDGESTDSGPLKNYTLCTDSESDMKAWISAITEEIKPMIGETYQSRAGIKANAANVDQKAFDVVTASASEGPKLTHLTASRPKMKGRRPPKRYAVFHEEEDDSKEDGTESPPGSPMSPRKPLPPSPSSSPSSTPSNTRKGSRPLAPMLPSKAPLTPPSKPKPVDQIGVGEVITNDAPKISPKLSFSKPQPPRKPSSRDNKQEPVTAATVDGGEAVSKEETPKPVSKPVPPKKPKTSTENPPLVSAEVPPPSNETKVPPTPPSKPHPPRAKPRSVSTMESFDALPRQTSPDPPTPTKRPIPAARPTPIPRKRDTRIEASEEVAAEEVKPMLEDQEVLSEGSISKTENESSPNQIQEVVEEKPSDITEKNEEKPSDVERKEEGASLELLEEDEKSTSRSLSEERREEADDIYEDMDGSSNVAADGNNGEYELVDYEKEELEKKEDNKNTAYKIPESGDSSYVQMAPAESVKIVKESSLENRILVNNEPKDECMEADSWKEPAVSARSSAGFIPMDINPTSTPEETNYDVLPPPRPAYIDSDLPPPTPTSSPNPAGETVIAASHLQQSPEVGRRKSSLASSGSMSSEHSGICTHEARKGSKGKASLSSSRSNSTSGTGGYDINSYDEERKKMSSLADGTEKSHYSSNSVPGTLQQAKEILRLAQAVRAEAEQMKEEAFRELELARRERHDASLLKKNAAEILKIAKTRLATT